MFEEIKKQYSWLDFLILLSIGALAGIIVEGPMGLVLAMLGGIFYRPMKAFLKGLLGYE